MDLGGLGWGLQTIIGAALLAAVILWALLRNRGSSGTERDETEAATRDLYKEEDRAHRHEDDDVP